MKSWLLFLITAFVAFGSTHASSVKKPTCKGKIDLAIVLDASASMGEEKFAKSKVFAKDLLSQFDISPQKTHVSLTYFSFYTYFVTNFDDMASLPDLEKELKKMKYEGSITNLGHTLEGLRSKVFAKALGARKGEKDSKMVAVFLSDGFDSMGHEELSLYVKVLHNFGVETYVGLVDGRTSKDGAEALVSADKKEHLFTMYNDPRKRQTEAERMAKSICKLHHKPKETIAEDEESISEDKQ